MCTDATPMELKKIFPDMIISNSEYGNVSLIFEKVRFEITTFRKELKYKDHRRPEKTFYVNSLDEDLKRRDFTINTLCIDKNGKEIDLMRAKDDLDNKIIRMVGNPKTRLKEDALRILRAVRFATVLNFKIEDNLKGCIKRYGHYLRKLSSDRKKEELDIIFASNNKEYGIELLNELKLTDYLDIGNLKKIKITPSMIVTWAQLNVLDKYNFTSAEKDVINKINDAKTKDILNPHVLYTDGLYVCTLVAELNGVDKKALNEVYMNMQIKNRTDIALEPLEICDVLNKKAGKFLKELIDDLEDKILDGKLDNNKKDITDYLLNNYFEKA